MAVEKLSISMESALAKLIRNAASQEGVSVSTWLADAASAKARLQALREALDAFTAEYGEISADEAARLITAARKRSIVVRPKARRK